MGYNTTGLNNLRTSKEALMGKKNNCKEMKKKLTKKEKKAANHLKLVHGKKSHDASGDNFNQQDQKKAA